MSGGISLRHVKEEVSKYLYLEDTGVIDVALGTVLTNRLSLDDKVWLAIVGESSGGKSQLITPIMKSDTDYFIKVDDITDNTFLSAAGGKEVDHSLLTADKTNNMMVFSDLTVLFSKNAESRNAILSQFRMIFDGHLVKRTGTKQLEWKGRMGVLAGCTPSIYGHFAEVADMGERFIYYRLRGNDPEKATRLVLERALFGNELDNELSNVFGTYIEEVGRWLDYKREEVVLSQEIKDHILEISMFAETLRTPVPTNFKGEVNGIPVRAMPMRTALQLKAMAKALVGMQMYESHIGGDDAHEIDILGILDWLAYSLADEEKRKMLEVFSTGEDLKAQQVADYIGLDTSIVRGFMTRLTATGVLERVSGYGAHKYKMENEEYLSMIRRLVKYQDVVIPEERNDYEDDE